MTDHLLQEFINDHEYDIRKTRNGRWIDQKCALDEVCFVADCVVAYLDDGGEDVFHSPDIWHSEYAIKYVQSMFSKPDPRNETATDEFNKFFRQPLKLLAAAGVLTETRQGNTIEFRVKNRDVLEFIAQRERNAFTFLCLYIEKTLRDSGLWDVFASFFDEQTKERFDDVKDAFERFCYDYTPIKNRAETGRIFAKVINPLACKRHKRGTLRGNLSKNMITYDMLMYNQANWRDLAVGKEKNISRKDFLNTPIQEAIYDYEVERAKRTLHRFNDRYNGGRSEVQDRFSVGQLATHMHHIFPKGEFPEIAATIENLIALTSGQHLQEAHPAGNTTKVDKAFQYACLIAKTDTIQRNLNGDIPGAPVIYDFEEYMRVLDIGLRTDYFEGLTEGDFTAVLTGIEFNC